MEKLLESLKEFWILISTPGSKLPMETTIIVLIVIVLFAILMPAFMQWRAYRRQNPLPGPKEKLEQTTREKKKSPSKMKKKK